MVLSIITINYNNIEGLKKTFSSVSSQSFKDYEWIVIDGGSTDGSRDFIEEHASTFSFWCSEKDNGIYDALNKGIRYASGDYISCMNAGDAYFENDTLDKIFAERLYGDIVYGDWVQQYSNHQTLNRMPFPLDFSIFYYHNICHQAMFVRTELLKQKQFDESFGVVADYARWMELLFAGASFQHINTIVCCYDMTGVSSQSNAGWEECLRIRKEIVPSWMTLTIQRLEHYEHSLDHMRLELLLQKNNIFTKVFVRILKWLDKRSLHLDEKTMYQHNFPGQTPEVKD